MKTKLINHISHLITTTTSSTDILDLVKSLQLVTSLTLPKEDIPSTIPSFLQVPDQKQTLLDQKHAEHVDIEPIPTKISKVQQRANIVKSKLLGMMYITSKCSLSQLKGTCSTLNDKPLTERQIEHAVRTHLYNEYAIVKGNRLPKHKIGASATVYDNQYYVIPRKWVNS